MSIIHYTILITSKSDTKTFVGRLLKGTLSSGFMEIKEKKGALFSSSQLDHFLNEEERHGIKIITEETEQSLLTMSSGERKKNLLNYLLKQKPEYLILLNPYDNLDKEYQQGFKEKLIELSNSIVLIQVISRKEDALPLYSRFAKLEADKLIHYKDKDDFLKNNAKLNSDFFDYRVPRPLKADIFIGKELVKFKDLSVSYNGKPVLSNITWSIRAEDFWQLKGPNGSGKTTLLSMMTGDNQKAYGQNIQLFGLKKGGGESVWDIKKHIGYFTPSMTDKFKGYHTLENMLISGLHDSIGLYVKPTETEKRLASEWLQLLNLKEKKSTYFHQLSTSEKRLLMTARAMIKHPPLLLLDEPTAGLDDNGASLFIALVNQISAESNTAIVFVSHREEKGLQPSSVFELVPNKNGAIGKIHYF